jgi:hypothetical protein
MGIAGDAHLYYRRVRQPIKKIYDYLGNAAFIGSLPRCQLQDFATGLQYHTGGREPYEIGMSIKVLGLFNLCAV